MVKSYPNSEGSFSITSNKDWLTLLLCHCANDQSSHIWSAC
jgi:hypothetical protein